jgi:hypothetical protein
MNASQKKELILVAIVLVIGFMVIIWTYPQYKSIRDGGPSWPKGCSTLKQPLNMTYSGQVISVSLFNRSECCTKIRTYPGISSKKERICWNRVIDSKVVKQDKEEGEGK